MGNNVGFKLSDKEDPGIPTSHTWTCSRSQNRSSSKPSCCIDQCAFCDWCLPMHALRSSHLARCLPLSQLCGI